MGGEREAFKKSEFLQKAGDTRFFKGQVTRAGWLALVKATRIISTVDGRWFANRIVHSGTSYTEHIPGKGLLPRAKLPIRLMTACQ